MKNHLVWCDIPVKDLERAQKFYAAVLGVDAQKMEGHPVVFFAHEEEAASGCLVQTGENKPSREGPLLYFNVNGCLDEAVAKVEEFGGKVLNPKEDITPYGFRAIIIDSEGNRLALHSKN